MAPETNATSCPRRRHELDRRSTNTTRGRITGRGPPRPRGGIPGPPAPRPRVGVRRVLARWVAAFGARRGGGFPAERDGALRVAGRAAPDLAVARRLPAGVAAGVLTRG